MHGFVRAITYHLPPTKVTNEHLAHLHPDWNVQKTKTGIDVRSIAGPHECASDLALRAAIDLFKLGVSVREEVDYLLFCTQTPDYLVPATACILQNRLNLSMNIGALDFNLGCSGYVYGLGLADALIKSGQARTVLLLTGDTYSKFLDPDDKNTTMLFGDAGTATLICLEANSAKRMESPVYGTDGSGAGHLIVPESAFREGAPPEGHPFPISMLRPGSLYMNGAKIVDFVLTRVPEAVNLLLERSALRVKDIDLFIFHQANEYILRELGRALNIPSEKLYIDVASCGNTVSSTIPIALERAFRIGLIQPKFKVMLVGFGVGFSWAATILSY
jgi:3-oxoacyl-[acyl-carrier-protein] synthase-3